MKIPLMERERIRKEVILRVNSVDNKERINFKKLADAQKQEDGLSLAITHLQDLKHKLQVHKRSLQTTEAYTKEYRTMSGFALSVIHNLTMSDLDRLNTLLAKLEISVIPEEITE